MDGFRFQHSIRVRFSDLDAASHVHHSLALVYFEEARWAYWAKVVGEVEDGDWGYVLARAQVKWSRRILWPQTLSVGVRVTKIGSKSFEMAYRISGPEGPTLVSGSTTQVTYDFDRGVSRPVPRDLRNKLTEFDGPLP